MIKAEAVYQDKGKGAEPKFDHFKLTIGDRVYEPIPISFLRKTELFALEEMLKYAAKVGEEAT